MQHDADRVDRDSQPRCPRPELVHRCRAELHRTDSHNLGRDQDAERQLGQPHEPGDESGRAGNDLTGGELDDPQRDRRAGQEQREWRHQCPQTLFAEVQPTPEPTTVTHAGNRGRRAWMWSSSLTPSPGVTRPEEVDGGCVGGVLVARHRLLVTGNETKRVDLG